MIGQQSPFVSSFPPVSYQPHNYICITKEEPRPASLAPTVSHPYVNNVALLDEAVRDLTAAVLDARSAQRVGRHDLRELFEERDRLWQRLRVIEDLATSTDFEASESARDVRKILQREHLALRPTVE